MQPRVRLDRIAVALLSLAVFVVGHDLLFLLAAGSGYRAALISSGHGLTWDIAAATVVSVAAVLAGLAARRLVSLSRLATTGGSQRIDEPRETQGHLIGEVVRLWAVLLAAALLVLVVNENLERAFVGLPLPGLSVLVAGAPVLAVVAMAVAIVAALYGWQRDMLIARIASARQRWSRSPRASYPRIPWVDRRQGSSVGRRESWRAPPSMAYAR